MRKLIVAGLFVATPALAVSTPAGPTFTIPVPGTTAVAEPGLAGTVVTDTLTPFANSGGVPIHGTVQVRTVRAADGTLAFYWKINNDATSAGGVSGLLAINFPQVSYDANWRRDGLGTIAPANVVAFPTGGLWMLGFGFAGAPVGPGQSSRFMFLKSNATTTRPTSGVLSFSTGGNSAPFAIVAPIK